MAEPAHQSGEPIRYSGDLESELAAMPDRLLYARTPHGTYTFQVAKVELDRRQGEPVVVLVLQEVPAE
jgi:hypothetical protein